MSFSEKALELHKKNKGKIEVRSRVPLDTKEDLSVAYTPGVGAVCLKIKEEKNQVWELTNRGNTVAIVSDGTAILGLGDIGPEAGLPVMEGKSCIFKEFANVDAVPLCVKTRQVDEIVDFCKNIEPSFGGINLEDISAPRCFEVVDILEKELNIAVFHDDQDGTAIVTLAGLINAFKLTGKNLHNAKIVINGAGAGGIATTRLLLAYGVKDIILIDSAGAIYEGRSGLNPYKENISRQTNHEKLTGRLEDCVVGRDVFIGLSKAKLVNEKMISTMNRAPIVFALANPEPEIMPDKAYAAGAAVVGTGRSDFPNQINNALVFPGVFRGLLDGWKKKMTTTMKLAAAQGLASVVRNPSKDRIIPNITDNGVMEAIRDAVKNTD